MDPSADGQYCGHIRLFAFAALHSSVFESDVAELGAQALRKADLPLAPGAACLGKSAPAQIGRAS